MTVIPTDEDHPDFTRPSQFTSAAILSVTANATSAPSEVGRFYTGGYESMIVRTGGLAAGPGWVFTFSWFADQALTVPTGQLNLRTVSVVPVNAQIPNRGPWCLVSVVTTLAAPHQFSLIVLPRAGTPSAGGAFLDGLVHGGFGTVIGGPGGVLQQNAFSVTPGEACLTVATTSAAWTAQVFGLDELSAQYGSFAGLSSAGGAFQSQRFILPVTWTQLQITNADAGARVFNFATQAAL